MPFEELRSRRPSYVSPCYSKSRVNRAGDAFARHNPALEDHLVLENWRTSHAYLLNTFQAALRGKARDKDIFVAQRLKRQPTIVGKLRRYPKMQLARMHDIAAGDAHRGSFATMGK